MAEAVVMPRLDMTSEEMTILRWLKAEGEYVEAGDPLLEVMTEKVSIEIDAPTSGYVGQLAFGPDDVVPVGEVIAYISEEPQPVNGGPGAAAVAGRNAERQLVRAAPVVRRIAAELRIDLERVAGTGPGGRVLAEDVRAHAARVGPSTGTTESEAAGDRAGTDPAAVDRSYEETQLTGMRRTIARRMAASWREAPHVTLTKDVDMSAAAAFRKRLRNAVVAEAAVATGAAADDVSLTWNSFIAWVAVQALVRSPGLNATLKDDTLRRYDDVHLGVAVDVPSGLVVPVIRQAQQLTPSRLAKAIADKAERALAGRLGPADVQGGTFTLTNLGGFGIGSFTPIINPPQIAILGVGAVRDEVIPVGGEPAVRPVCTFSLSIDHRAVDGADGARYLALLAELLADPHRLVV